MFGHIIREIMSGITQVLTFFDDLSEKEDMFLSHCVEGTGA